MKKTSILVLFFIVRYCCADPISLHPDNPHYLLYKDKPTVLITSGEHYGAVLNMDFDYETYLQTLEKDKQNLSRLFVGSYVEKQGAFGIKQNTLAPAEYKYLPPWARSKTPGYLNGGNKFDLSQFNNEYFTRLKDFIKKAENCDVIVEIVLFSSIYTDENWRYMPFHPENNINDIHLLDRKKVHTLDNGNILDFQEKMVRKIVRELNEFDNIYFEIQNEPWADTGDSAGVLLDHLADDDLNKIYVGWQNKLEVANKYSVDWQKKIADLIVDEEKNLDKRHLVAQNYCNFFYPIPKVQDNISILNFHYALPQAVALNYGYNRPISFDESGFAGQSADVYRRQAWRFILSGGAVFDGLDYSFYPGHEDGMGTLSGPGGGGKLLRSQLGILRTFIESFDLPRLHPDAKTITFSPGLYPYLLSTQGQQYAGYFEGRGETTISLNLPDGQYDLKWIDVKTGQIIKEEKIVGNFDSTKISVPAVKDGLGMSLKKMN